MANVFVLDRETLKLKSFSIIKELRTDDFTLEHKDTWNDVRLDVFRKTNQGYDICNLNKSYQTEPHYHEGEEHRLFLRGQGIFYIPIDDELFCIECLPGDLIWLRPKLIHWFSTSGNMTAARFFASDTKHKDVIADIPHSIFRLKDQVSNFNIKL